MNIYELLQTKLGENIELKISYYDNRYNNLKLSLRQNNDELPDLTVDPEKKFVSRQVLLNVKEYPFLKEYINKQKICLWHGYYYLKEGENYPICSINLIQLKDYDPSGYERYRLRSEEYKDEDKKWSNHDLNDRKPEYKTTDVRRDTFNRYHAKTKAIVAYLPPNTKKRISKYGELPTTFLKMAINDYLDYLEGGMNNVKEDT